MALHPTFATIFANAQRIAAKGARTWQCDGCGKFCSRTHNAVSCGCEGTFCDTCFGYDWAAYDEAPDPVLHPELETER